MLIIHLSAGHTDIQKLITFQGTLDQLFAIVEHEGGVDGGIVVQDCLQLMSNLLSFNVSNQNYFRETGCVPKLAKLLTLTDDEKGGEGISPSAKEQRDANVQYALRLLRLFVVPGGLGTVANQNALVGAGLLHIVTTIAFLSSCELPARAEALKAVADLIDGNESLQHSFSQIQVALPSIQPPPPPPPPPASAPAKKEVEEGAEEAAEGIAEEAGEEHCGVIEALLDLALWDSTATGHAFDARFAACRCLEAYFHGNSPVRTFFLKHAIELHSVADPSPNALTSLLRLDSASRADPYRVWIASVIAIHLIYDDTAAKALAAEMREGDADAGEEVVTAIQGISANLVTALQHQYDPRIAIGFLMLLCIWLYGDSDAVDDFLSETSSVQSLVSAVKENGVDPVVQGLATFLLGILYEFSHQTSPVTRLHLHQLLATQMTRDLYVNKITVLRSHPLIRDFEASKDDRMPGHRRRKHGLPEVYFDHVFIEFLKENYSTVMRAIDKAPELETRVLANGTVKASNGVNLEELQSLRAQLAEASERLERIEADRERERQATEQKHSAALEQLERDRHDEREALKAQHSAALVGLEKAKRNAETQLATAQSSSKRARDALNAEQRKNRDELDRLQKRAEADKVASEERLRSFVEDLTQRNRRLMEEKEAQLKTLREQAKELPPLKRRLDEAAGELEDRERKLDHMRRQAEELVKRTNTIVAEREERLQVVQARLQEAEANFLALQQASEEVQRKAAAAELERQTQQEEEQGRLRGQLERAQQALSEKEGLLAAQREEHDRQLAEIQRKIEAAQEEHVAELESSLALADELKENLNVARKDLAAAAAAAADDLQRRKQEEGAKSKAEEGQLAKAMQEKEELQKKSTELQTEIEDLFMVMGDLEEKRKNDKVPSIPVLPLNSFADC